MKNSMEVPQETKDRTTIWSNNSTPGSVWGKNENTNLKRYMHPNVYSSTIYNSHDNMEATPSAHQGTTGFRRYEIHTRGTCTGILTQP